MSICAAATRKSERVSPRRTSSSKGAPGWSRRRDSPRRLTAARPATHRAGADVRLGVVAREVTLLPRHWDWLAAQPGGASVALRKLVDEARREHGERDRRRLANERAYHFMSALAGDLPGFEEASRALFAGDMPGFRDRIEAWPRDLREHLLRLAEPEAQWR